MGSDNAGKPPPAEIRPAIPADRDALLSLLSRQLEEHAIDLAGDRLAAAVDGVFDDPTRGIFLVASVGAAIVGVAYVSFVWTIEHGGRAAWLEELYVEPARREHKIGTALVEAILDRARSAGCAAVDLEIERGHERVESLYLRHGFRQHSRTHWVKPLR